MNARMNVQWATVRAGWQRGRIELRHTYTDADTLIPTIIVLGGFILAMVFTRRTTVPGTHFSLGTMMLVSILGMNIGVNGLATMGGLLAAEREDGTLLRAKAIPNGMAGYLIGKIVAVSGVILIGVSSTLIFGSFLFHGLALGNLMAWLTLIWVLALGLVATLPIGAILGSLFPSARSAGLITLFIGGIAAVSGIFYPITHLPTVLQWVGQVFPLYWLGLGMRSALLPAQPGLGRNRPLVAASGHVRRAGRVGGGGAARRAGTAAAGGPARVGVGGGRAPREGHASDSVRTGSGE